MKISDKDFNRVVTYIKSNYGIDLSKKRLLIEGRLNFPAISDGKCDYSKYLDRVLKNTESPEYIDFINRITTNHTFFMRETKHYDFFVSQFLKEVKNNERGRDIRIWSAGCSFGHEPYNMAMYIDDTLGITKAQWDLKILATDISHKALIGAKRGVFKNEDLSDLPDGWVRKYFKKFDEQHFQISDEIRSQIVFKYTNLMNEFVIKKPFDVIFCRNVMIYFDADTKYDLVERFVEALKPGGYLFVGHSESLTYNDKIEQIRSSIFKKL